MARLAWALAAAFVLHLVLFQVTLPVRQQAELTLRGSDHVTVRLTRLQESPFNKEADEPLEPVPVDEPEPPSVTNPEPEPEPMPEPMLAPVQKKTRIRDTVASEKTLKPDFVATTRKKEETAAPAPAPGKSVPAETGNPDAGVIRQAEPLPALNRPPSYPKLARKRGWEGTVVLEVDVNRDGTVESVRVRTSSSYTLLDREALAAVRKWRFTPGTMGGRPTATKVMVPIHFMLREN